MTEQSTAPTSVTIAASSEMTFPTMNTEGRTFTPQEQFDLRLKSPTWVKDAATPGTPAFADRERLVIAMAADEARRMGEPFEMPAGTQSPVAGVQPEQLTSPQHFALPYGDAAPATPEQREIDATVRGWLSQGGFDRDSGSHLAETVNKLLLRDWTAESIGQHQQQSDRALRQVWGADFERNVQLVSDYVDAVEAKAPGLIAFLEAAPFVIREPMVAQHLLNHAMRRAAGV